jgi:predicted restriction endonuclease
MHKTNPEIVKVAKLIGRTPSALAMKLVNFASLDPAITSTGRRGHGNASEADRAIWVEFHQDWERLAVKSSVLMRKLGGEEQRTFDDSTVQEGELASYAGKSRKAMVDVRMKQSFFRRAVLSSYQNKCCMSGISLPALLNASHIVPWAVDKDNRLNPRNGLCLSALHDRAFDKGLITVSLDFRIRVSRRLKTMKDAFTKATLIALDGKPITLPEKFRPSLDFLEFHIKERFEKQNG